MAKKRQPPRRTKKTNRKTFWDLNFKRKKKDDLDFKPDAKVSTWGKTARLTRLQQLRLAKWALYVLTVVLCLVTQDVLMSRIRILGATTDLAVCAILLILIATFTAIFVSS